jgi:hypothetical protein
VGNLHGSKTLSATCKASPVIKGVDRLGKPGRITFSRKENNNMREENLTDVFDSSVMGVSIIHPLNDEGQLNHNKNLRHRKELFQLDQAVFHPDFIAFALRFGAMEDS